MKRRDGWDPRSRLSSQTADTRSGQSSRSADTSSRQLPQPRDSMSRQPYKAQDTSSRQPSQPRDHMSRRFPLTRIDDGRSSSLSQTLVNKDLNIDEFGSMDSDNEDTISPPINQNYSRDTKFMSGNYDRRFTHDIIPNEEDSDGISIEDFDGLPVQVTPSQLKSVRAPAPPHQVNFIRTTEPGSAIFHKTADGIPTDDYDGLPIQVSAAQRKSARESPSTYRVNFVRSSKSGSAFLKTVDNSSIAMEGPSSSGASNFQERENPSIPDASKSSSNVSTLIQAMSEWSGQEALKTLGSIDPSGLHDIDTDAILLKAKLAVIQELLKTCPENSGNILTDSDPKVATNIDRFPSSSKTSDRRNRASDDQKLKLSWHSAPVDRRLGESSILKSGDVDEFSGSTIQKSRWENSPSPTREPPEKVKPVFGVLSGVKSAPGILPHNSNTSVQIHQVATPPVVVNRFALPPPLSTNRVVPSSYRSVGSVDSNNTSATSNPLAFPRPLPVNRMTLSHSGPVLNNASLGLNPLALTPPLLANQMIGGCGPVGFGGPYINTITPTSTTGYAVSSGSYNSSLNTLVEHNTTSLSFPVSTANQSNVFPLVMPNISAPPHVLGNTTNTNQSHLLHQSNPLPYGHQLSNNILMNMGQSSSVSLEKSIKNIHNDSLSSEYLKMDIETVVEKSRVFINQYKHYSKCRVSPVKKRASRSPPRKATRPLLRSKSPVRRGTSRSPPLQRARNPLSPRSKSPVRRRASRSPPRKARTPLHRNRSPVRRRTSRSPRLRRVRSPLLRRSRSPVRRRTRSPPLRRVRSPLLRRSRSPVRRRTSRSPPRKARSPLRRGQSPVSRRTAQSPPMFKRSKSPARRRTSRSPPLRKARSPRFPRSMSPENRRPVRNSSPDKHKVRTSTRSPHRIPTITGRDDMRLIRSNDRQRNQSPGQKGQQQIGKDNKIRMSESSDRKDSQIKRSKDGRGIRSPERKNAQLTDEKGSKGCRQSNTDKREDRSTSDKDGKPKSIDILIMERGTWLSNSRENTRLVCERKFQPNSSKYSKGANLRLAKLSQAVDKILPQVPKDLDFTAANEEDEKENNRGGKVCGPLSEQAAETVVNSDTSKNQEANSQITAGIPHNDHQAARTNNVQLETPVGNSINSKLTGDCVIPQATSELNVDSNASEMPQSFKEVEISLEPDLPSANDVTSLSKVVDKPKNPSQSDKDVLSAHLLDDEIGDDVLDFDEEPSLFHTSSPLSNVREEGQSSSTPPDDEQWIVVDEVENIRENAPQSSDTRQESAVSARPDNKKLPPIVDESKVKLNISVEGNECETKQRTVVTGNDNQTKKVTGHDGDLLQSGTSKLPSSQTDQNISEDVKAITLKFNEELVKIKMEVQKTATMAVNDCSDRELDATVDPSSEENRQTRGSHKLQMLLDEIDDVDKHIQDLIAEVDKNELGTEGDLEERSGIESKIMSVMVLEESNTPDIADNQGSEDKINVSDITVEKLETAIKSVEEIEKSLLQGGSEEKQAQIRQEDELHEAVTAEKMLGVCSRLGPPSGTSVDPKIDTSSALAGHETKQSAEESQNTKIESVGDTTIASDDPVSHLYTKSATMAIKDCDDRGQEAKVDPKTGGSHNLQMLLSEIDDVDKTIGNLVAEGHENELDTEITVRETESDLEERSGIESKIMSEMVLREGNIPDIKDNQSSENKINVSDKTIEKLTTGNKSVEEIGNTLLQSWSEEKQAQIRQGIQTKTDKKIIGVFSRLGPPTETSVDLKIDSSSALAGHKTNQSAKELHNTKIESVDGTAVASDDPVSHLYPKTPQKIILLKPESSIECIQPDIVEFGVKRSLKSDGFRFSAISVVKGRRVGAPYDHAQIVFHSVEESIKWYEKHKGSIRLAYSPDNLKSIEFSLHYTVGNWWCKVEDCKVNNFWCRSICYSCCAHKDQKRGVKFGIWKSKMIGVKRLGFDEEQILRKLNLGSFAWRSTVNSLRIVYDQAMNCCSGLCIIECASMNKSRALKPSLADRFSNADVGFVEIDDEVNSSIRCQLIDLSLAASFTDSDQLHTGDIARPSEHPGSDDPTSFDEPGSNDPSAGPTCSTTETLSADHLSSRSRDRSGSKKRTQRRNHNRSPHQTRRHYRSRSGNRTQHSDRSRSGHRSRLRDRSHSGNRTQRRDRSLPRNRTLPRDRSCSGNRTEHHDSSRSRNRTQLRHRSRSGNRTQRRDRSHFGNRIQSCDHSRSTSHTRPHDRSRSGSHARLLDDTHSDDRHSPSVYAPENSNAHSPYGSNGEFQISDHELDSVLSPHSSLHLHDDHSDSELSLSSHHSYDPPGISPRSSPHRDDSASPSRPPKPNGFTDFIYPLPDINKFIFEASTGLYFDPYTSLYYDSDKDLFYNDDLDIYLVYKSGRYVSF